MVSSIVIGRYPTAREVRCIIGSRELGWAKQLEKIQDAFSDPFYDLDALDEMTRFVAIKTNAIAELRVLAKVDLARESKNQRVEDRR